MWSNDTLNKILIIGLGSALGGNARYWLCAWTQERYGTWFPLGTFIVNISGAFVLGFFASFLAERLDLVHAPMLRLLFAVGFLGSYTTFSTLEYETYLLNNTGSHFLALANAFGSLSIGYFAIWLGVVFGRAL